MSKDQTYRKKTPDEIRDDIAKRSAKIDQEYLFLGKDLYVAKHCEHYLKWGYSTWREYVESEANLSIKRDERLRKVWKTLVKGMGVTAKDLHDIGFSKASLICKDGLLTRKNLKDWLEKARSSSFRELEKAVKTKGKRVKVKTVEETDADGAPTGAKKKVRVVTTEDGDEEEFESLSFSVTDDQREVIDEALTKAELLAESTRRGHLLHLICTDFLAGNLGEDPKERARLRFHLRNLEDAFGTKIMALPQGEEATEAIMEFVASRPDLFDLTGEVDDDDEEE